MGRDGTGRDGTGRGTGLEDGTGRNGKGRDGTGRSRGARPEDRASELQADWSSVSL